MRKSGNSSVKFPSYISFSVSLVVAAAFLSFAPFATGAELLPVGKKNLPEITLNNISPPYRDYKYFQHHERFPFEYQSSSFSMVNAWWLAEVSTLAYADEAYVQSQFRKTGLNGFKFFTKHSTQCFVVSNREFAILAFRGTEIGKREESLDIWAIVADLTADVDARLAEWPQGGKVHQGFKEALEEVWDDICPYMENLADRGCKIWVTGHSLGAALATLAAHRFEAVQGLYTFGSPRVGDSEFQRRFRLRAFRIVNGSDIFSNVPPAGMYRHVGTPKFIDPSSSLLRDRPFADPYPGNPNLTDVLREIKDFASWGLIPDSIRDHVPVLYAVALWNRLVDSRS